MVYDFLDLHLLGFLDKSPKRRFSTVLTVFRVSVNPFAPSIIMATISPIGRQSLPIANTSSTIRSVLS